MSTTLLFQPTLAEQLSQAVDVIIQQLPDGDLNRYWLPRQLISLEMPSKATLREYVQHDIRRLQRTRYPEVARELLQIIEQKVIVIKRLAQKYQTLSDNASHSRAAFRAEQASIFWVSRRGEKSVKLRLAKLKKAQKAIQAEIETLRQAVDVVPTSLLSLLAKESHIKRQIELMRQKVEDRVDPLRQPQTYCVRTNPMAYTQFEAPPTRETSNKTETLVQLKALLQTLSD